MSTTATRAGLVSLLLAVTVGGCNIWADVDPDTPGVQTDPTSRSQGTRMNDGRIESLGMQNIRAASPDLEETNISIVAHNGIALILGQVPTEEAKAEAGRAVARVDVVRTVYNELEIGSPTGTLARTNDAYLTSKVKTKLVAAENINGAGINVTTENGVVYLMGLIRRHDADEAVDITRNTGGVERVVRVFEYVD